MSADDMAAFCQIDTYKFGAWRQRPIGDYP